MSCPNWRDLIPCANTIDNPEALEKATAAAEVHGYTISYGISAIGHLLAVTADNGELSDDTAMRIGWMLESIGDLTGVLVNFAEVARGNQLIAKE